MALFVRSSAEGDAKLKFTEAALTGEEVDGGGSPFAADAAACSCLFFSWNFAARSLSRWIFLNDIFFLLSLGDGCRLGRCGVD